MPERRKGESTSKYISRFVTDPHEERKFPNKRQRLAVGYAEARESAEKRKRKSANV